MRLVVTFVSSHGYISCYFCSILHNYVYSVTVFCLSAHSFTFIASMQLFLLFLTFNHNKITLLPCSTKYLCVFHLNMHVSHVR